MDKNNLNMEPKIIFEDSEILILEKPSGLTVNKADTTKGEMTVQDWVESKFKVQPDSIGTKFKIDEESYFYERAGIVHRIDKETSGILIAAKTSESFIDLQRQFKERVVQKTYTALAHGKVSLEVGEINVPVGRLPWNRKRFGIVAGGREAVTKFKVQSSKFKIDGATLSLLELYPRTGRTHQIRVHLKYFGHPIFSDPLYGGRKAARSDRKILPRLFLHASKISFLHPKTKKQVSFESPLPEELSNFLKNLS